jgi:transposase
MLTVFWDIQGTLLAHFQKCGENMNSASYCEVLLKLWDTNHRKRPGQLARGKVLHHDNARPHTTRANKDTIQDRQWELLEHPPYNPDLVPSDFHLFGSLKKHLGDKRLADDEEIKTGVRRWLRQQSKDIDTAAFDPLVKRWERVSMSVENMSRNVMPQSTCKEKCNFM